MKYDTMPERDQLLFIVTGDDVRSAYHDTKAVRLIEQAFDRWVAKNKYRMRTPICRITLPADRYLADCESAHYRPVISIGPPLINTFSQMMWDNRPNGKPKDSTAPFFLQLDEDMTDLRVSLIGRSTPQDTLMAARYFRRHYFNQYMWSAATQVLPLEVSP